MSDATQLFQDPEMQATFNRQGYIIVDFLTEKDISHLLAVFHEMNPKIPEGGFVSSSYSEDFEYKKTASERITTVFKTHFARLLKDYQPFGSAFLFKNPVDSSELPIHQDWTIVDETKYIALNVWVPLCDVNETNGALQVLPGSHSRYLQVLRSPTLPFFFTDHEQLMMDNLKPLYVKAGQAVILNQSLIHYSPPNFSDKIRIAITSGVKSKDAPMQFFYKNMETPDSKVEQFAMEDDFLISFGNFFQDIFKRPQFGESKGFIDYTVPRYSAAELEKMVVEMRQNADPNWTPNEKTKIATVTNEVAKNSQKGYYNAAVSGQTPTVKILKDSTLDKQLEEEGYVVIPFLNEAEIESLLSLYKSTHPETPDGLYATAHLPDLDFRMAMNEGIKKGYKRAIDQVFHECMPLGGSFIVKAPGEAGILYPHQDWNIVDENEYRSFNIWVPLVDTTAENGAIYILERSHKMLKTYRGPNIPCAFHKIHKEVWEQMTPLPMKAGEAFIYDHRLLHASDANSTDQLRIATVYGIMPKAAEMLYYYQTEANGKPQIEVFENNLDFFFKQDISKGPLGLKSLKTMDYDFPVLSAAQFRHLYFGEPMPESPSLPEATAAPKEADQATAISAKNDDVRGGFKVIVDGRVVAQTPKWEDISPITKGLVATFILSILYFLFGRKK